MLRSRRLNLLLAVNSVTGIEERILLALRFLELKAEAELVPQRP